MTPAGVVMSGIPVEALTIFNLHKNMGHYRLTSFGTADAINVTILYTLVSTLSFL